MAMVVSLHVYLEVGIGLRLVTFGIAAVGLLHIHMVALNLAVMGLLALAV